MIRQYRATHAASWSIWLGLVAAGSGLILGCESRDKLARVTQERDQLRVQVEDLGRKAGALEQDLKSLASESDAAARIGSLRTENEQLRSELGKRADANAQLDLELASVRRELETSRAATESVQKHATEVAEENTKLKALLGDLNNPLSRLAVTEWKLAQALQGAVLIAQDDEHTFLGVLDFSGADPDSVFNDVGLHGSTVGIESIWNDVGFYGSEVGLYSARNDVCINPPAIVKGRKIIGYVTTNDVYSGSPRLNPHYLRSLASRIRGKD